MADTETLDREIVTKVAWAQYAHRWAENGYPSYLNRIRAELARLDAEKAVLGPNYRQTEQWSFFRKKTNEAVEEIEWEARDRWEDLASDPFP